MKSNLAQSLQQYIHMNGRKVNMCILSVITGGLLVTTSGCYAGVEVVEPDYVGYDSQVKY